MDDHHSSVPHGRYMIIQQDINSFLHNTISSSQNPIEYSLIVEYSNFQVVFIFKRLF